MELQDNQMVKITCHKVYMKLFLYQLMKVGFYRDLCSGGIRTVPFSNFWFCVQNSSYKTL